MCAYHEYKVEECCGEQIDNFHFIAGDLLDEFLVLCLSNPFWTVKSGEIVPLIISRGKKLESDINSD